MDAKTCSTCGDRFDPALSPNTRSRCRPCTTAYKAKWRKGERGARLYREGQARYLASDKGKAADKAKRLTPHGIARAKAGQAVGTEVSAGRMMPASEVRCAYQSHYCEGRHEYHHDSYLEGRRLHVRCFCKAHHAAWHRDNNPTYPAVRAAREAGK